MLNFPNLEQFGVFLYHSFHPTIDDGTHQRTRELLDALASCSRLRSLHITHGEPETRPFYSLRRPVLSSARVDLLRDHFSRTPPAHPHLEELKITITYWAKDVERAWAAVISQLAAALCDRARYPAFRRLCVCKAVAFDRTPGPHDPDLEAARRICSRLFSGFAVPGVEVVVEAKVLFGEFAEKEDFGLDPGVPDGR
ncbi:uncharacterized protein BXZ73DRAFT_99141 [Epithele typhae]|uniref:uncharacterized protein n=1 Tax=Epithele typhae TaxID=378194 RepID=UPI0020089904|nr:uncharacterized protein BXZ73DRAFT_99141 [Epithele typhae]KAH9940144.1 hypothetical protein BXZ73DRAFT_99141 [Epithele typhae]